MGMKIAFYVQKGNWIDGAIRLFSWSKTSHVELVFSDGKSFSSSSRDGGVRFTDITFDAGWEVFDLEELGISVDEVSARAWCEDLAKRKLPYDWKGVFRFVLPFIGQSAGAWFCSEVCATVLKNFANNVPAEILDKAAHKQSPGYMMESFENRKAMTR